MRLIKNLTQRFSPTPWVKPARWPWVQRVVSLPLAYLIWIKAVQVVSLSFLTYYAASGSQSSAGGKLQEISDLSLSIEVYVAGLSAGLFVLGMRALYPLTSLSSLRILLSSGRLRHSFLPGLFRGSAIATAFVGALLISRYYDFSGFFVQLDEPLFASIALAFKALALVIFVSCEEFLFRRLLFQALTERLSREYAALACILAYIAIKYLQFDLGILQTITLGLVSLALTAQSAFQRDFSFGAGQWSGILVIFHVVFGLPIFGIPQPGLLSIRYAGPLLDLDWASQVTRIMTGGTGGPLSSAAFQILVLGYFAIIIGSRFSRIKKFRWNSFDNSLKSGTSGGTRP